MTSEARKGSGAGAFAAWGLVVIALGVLGFLWLRGRERTPEEPKAAPPRTQSAEVREYIRRAEELLRQGHFSESRKVAMAAMKMDPEATQPVLIAAEASAELGEVDRAIEYYREIPPGNSSAALNAAFGIAAVEFYYGSFRRAEAALRELLKRRPTHVGGNELLSELLNVSGRRWESVPFALELVRQRKAGLETLLLLADLTHVITHRDRAHEAAGRDPDDVNPVLGLARAEFDVGDQAHGLKLLETVLSREPSLTEALVVRGEHLLHEQPSQFAAWHSELPEQAGHPGIWLLRGTFARRNGQDEAAARCFWEVLTRNPNDQQAHFQLGQILTRLGRAEEAKTFVDRGMQLSQLKNALKSIVSAGDNSSPQAILDVAVVLEGLGRGVEAAAWQAEAARRGLGSPPREPVRPPARNQRDVLTLWVRPDSNPALFVDLSEFPLPEIAADDTPITDTTSSAHGFETRFENQANELGVEFQYVPAPGPPDAGKRVIELTGGGVGAVDFDGDRYPDLFLTQGGLIPPQPDGPKPTDQLFRNLGDRFVDVTQLAGVGGTDYGQGLAVGDVNADGFPDLFVANLGANRLYLNQGDGTFADVTAQLNDQHEDWSTSVAIADLDGDSLPDIYVGNYLAGDDIYTLRCRPNPDVPFRICAPDQFEAAQDRIFRNESDGRFADRTSPAGIVVPQGKALGVLVANFDGRRGLQVFVGNDGVPNFYFEPQAAGQFTFRETATAIGIAMNGEGQAQACMGIAAGDADTDGLLDLFVTNFARESNTLYRGTGGLFEDATRAARLRDPSYKLLGFGTQFLDADLDGNPDLVLTNGHVDDFSYNGSPYRMPAQFMQNTGGGRFKELAADAVGSFFGEEHLGRGLCRLDWNRDGHPDFAVTHLDTPAAVLTNTSDTTGNFLSVKLVGTTTNRDAVGSSLTVTDGDWSRTLHRVAGDGYQSANDDVLIVGLGERQTAPRLEVRWLDGSQQEFLNVTANQHLVIVQGHDRVFDVGDPL